jgi:hypothetical protein
LRDRNAAPSRVNATGAAQPGNLGGTITMASSTYNIDVMRKSKDGILSFTNGSINIVTTCWWDPEVVIDAGTYTAYATRMANKTDGTDGGNREGIWLGKGVPYNSGGGKSNGIFIHKGTNPSWSDGCIVLPGALVYQMWSSIHPKEQPIITVTVRDETVSRGTVVPYKCMVADWF